LGSNIFDFSIQALSIAIGPKKTLKIPKKKKKKSVKNATIIINAQKKKLNFEKAVSKGLPISLTVNQRLVANRLG
jgi:hypothetical protein